MKLYHGTNVDFGSIDLAKGRPNKDFITIEQLVQGLTFRKLNNQYFFGTERAIAKLHRL